MPATKTATKAKKAATKAPRKAAKPALAKKKPASKSTDSTFAVIETGGKQYQVAAGQVLQIEIIKEFVGKDVGTKIVFDKVLLVDNGKDTQIGDPYLKGAKVEGTLEEEGKGKKVRVLRYRAKSRHLKQKGHRQPYMKVKIASIA